MSLSVYKLDNFLLEKGFTPLKYYTLDNVCIYIDVLSVETAEIFLLYIPSKYTFVIEKHKDCYSMEQLEMEENDLENYEGHVDNKYIENVYKEIYLDSDVGMFEGNLTKKLEINYKQEIKLKDFIKDDINEVKNNVRQLKRLSYCTQNIQYKLSIFYKNYVCCITRSNDISVYMISNRQIKSQKFMRVIIDLEIMYSDFVSIHANIRNVKKEIEKILEKNHLSNTKILQKLVNRSDDLIMISTYSYKKKKEYVSELEQYDKKFAELAAIEIEILNKMALVNEKYKSMAGLSFDIEKSHQLDQHTKKITEIRFAKEKIMKDMTEVKIKNDNAILEIDKIMFNNTVLIESVMRNLKKIEYI